VAYCVAWVDDPELSLKYVFRLPVSELREKWARNDTRIYCARTNLGALKRECGYDFEEPKSEHPPDCTRKALQEYSESIAAALKWLDEFMAAFNARDLIAWEKAFSFPTVRLASHKLVIIDKPGWHPPDTFTRGALKEWHHSAGERREVIHAGADKAHFDTRFTRYRADGSIIGGFDSVYVVNCEDGHWGVKIRPSFAP
jgi:hypothetical protein